MSDKPTTAEIITMLREFNCHADVQKLAADRLEADAPPKWTRWKDDKETWPEDSQEVIVHCGKIQSRDFATFNKPLKRFDLDCEGYITINEKVCVGPVEWRPLNDNDYPPEQ